MRSLEVLRGSVLRHISDQFPRGEETSSHSNQGIKAKRLREAEASLFKRARRKHDRA